MSVQDGLHVSGVDGRMQGVEHDAGSQRVAKLAEDILEMKKQMVASVSFENPIKAIKTEEEAVGDLLGRTAAMARGMITL